MEQLATILKNAAGLSDQEVEKIAPFLKQHAYPKNEIIFKAGKPCQFLYFILEGYVRFYELKDGLELTTSFGKPNRFVTPTNGFFNDKLNEEYLQAIAPTQILAIKKQDLEQLQSEIPNLLKAKTILIEDILQCKEERIKNFVQKDAKDRYKHFVQQHPDLMQVVSVNHLASYLGIKPETLSRIRSKVIF